MLFCVSEVVIKTAMRGKESYLQASVTCLGVWSASFFFIAQATANKAMTNRMDNALSFIVRFLKG